MPSGPEVRATVGRRPLRPTVPVQRAAAHDRDENGSADAVLPDPRSGRSWPAAGDQPGDAAPDLGIGAGTSSAIWVPESGPGNERSASAGDAGLPAVQRRMPQGFSSARRSAPAGDPAMQRATRPSLPLVRPSVPDAAPVSQANAAAAGFGQPVPTLQTALSNAARGPVLAPTATPVVQRVDGAAPVDAEAPEQQRSERDLDELARALFGRIRGQLRSELIHEREAKGLTFDNV